MLKRADLLWTSCRQLVDLQLSIRRSSHTRIRHRRLQVARVILLRLRKALCRRQRPAPACRNLPALWQNSSERGVYSEAVACECCGPDRLEDVTEEGFERAVRAPPVSRRRPKRLGLLPGRHARQVRLAPRAFRRQTESTCDIFFTCSSLLGWKRVPLPGAFRVDPDVPLPHVHHGFLARAPVPEPPLGLAFGNASSRCRCVLAD